MNVYFFSRHEAQDQMIADLGGTITQQFKGTISNIAIFDDRIKFLEMPLGGETETIAHSIPKDSIVVAVAPLPIQELWLKAGVCISRTTEQTRNNRQWRGNFQLCGVASHLEN